jgi:hypothetical protein
MPRGCLLSLAVAIIAAVGIVADLKAKQRCAEAERQERESQRRAEFVRAVQRGNDGSTIFFSEPMLAEELARDADCVANLRRANFFMADLSDPRYGKVRQLVNVREFSFYSCGGVDQLLRNVQGMPLVERIVFEPFQLAEADLQILSSFPNLKQVRLNHVVDVSYLTSLQKAAPHVEAQVEGE